ncbi:MAG: OmpA family protein [Gammaproteobacteria bacterium]|nr:OmpA family protein [Gammaproteobacteria bacterium]
MSHRLHLFTVLAAGAAFLAGCATAPVRSPRLEEARAQVQTLEADPLGQEAAADDLQYARANLHDADAALANHAPLPVVDHFAYLAERHAEAGQARAAAARARLAMARAQDDRNRLLLEAREHEAAAAKQQALSAQQQALSAQQQAEAAQRQAQLTQEQLAERDRQMQATQQQLADQQRQAQAAQDQARAAQDQAQAAQDQLAAAQQQLTDLKARRTERGMMVTLSDVLFDSGQATQKPGAALALDRLASYMRQNPNTKILVEGHTDSVGTEEYNQALSERRAEAVASALTARGLPADSIRAVGRGKDYPVATNATVAGRQQNRRVEIVFSDTSGRFAQADEGEPARR